MTWFFSRYLFGNIYVMWVEHLGQNWAICYCSIIRFPSLIRPLFVRKGFTILQKRLFVTTPSFEIFLKFLNTVLFKRHKFVTLYFALFPFSSLWFWQEFFLNLLLVYIDFLNSLFKIKGLDFLWQTSFLKVDGVTLL